MGLGLAEGQIRLADLFSGRVFSDDPSTIKKSKLEEHSAHLKRQRGTIKPLPEVKIDYGVIMPSATLYKIDPRDGETVFVDLETSGLDKKKDSVVEITIVSETGQVLMNTLVNPGIKIPKEVAVRTHKITDTMVKGEPSFSDIEPDIINVFSGKRVVVSYGISFEFKFFNRHLRYRVSL